MTERLDPEVETPEDTPPPAPDRPEPAPVPDQPAEDDDGDAGEAPA